MLRYNCKSLEGVLVRFLKELEGLLRYARAIRGISVNPNFMLILFPSFVYYCCNFL